MGQRRVSQGCKPGAVDIRALIEQVSHPFDAVSLPLSYSDNPGVNGVSDRGCGGYTGAFPTHTRTTLFLLRFVEGKRGTLSLAQAPTYASTSYAVYLKGTFIGGSALHDMRCGWGVQDEAELLIQSEV